MATFMVVDDSTFMRMVLTNIIEKAGYKVIAEASNGLEAIEKFIETSPDAVIMDLTMEHMDGMEALKKIKKINQNTEVIICSSMAHQYNVEEAIGAGASEFISKPVDEKS